MKRDISDYINLISRKIWEAAENSNREADLISYPARLSSSIHTDNYKVKPLYGSLVLTHRCNSKCNYCDVSSLPQVSVQYDQAIVAARELIDNGVFMIGLTGGEPSLLDYLPDIVDYIKKHKIVTQILTNGKFFQDKSLMMKTLEAGIDSVILSLDTLEQDNYYQIRGIQLTPLLDAFIHVIENSMITKSTNVSINCVISRLNIDNIVNLVRWSTERGVSVGLQPLHKNPYICRNKPEICFSIEDEFIIKNSMETILEMKKDGFLINNSYSYLEGISDFLIFNRLPSSYSCNAGYTNVIIDIDQNVRPCWAFRPIGNIYKNSLKDLLISPEFQVVRKKMYELKCSKCWSRSHTELEIDQLIMKKRD